jgi:hypothetical protein
VIRRRGALITVFGITWIVWAVLISGGKQPLHMSNPGPHVAIGLIALSADATPTITLSSTSGTPGTTVTVSGNGFPAGEIVALYIDSPNPYIGNPPPGPRADDQGAFQNTFTWPGGNYDSSHSVDPTKPGPHQVCGDTGYPGSQQPLSAKACAAFVAIAIPSPSPPTSYPGPGQLISVPELLVGFAILIAAAVGAVLWLRRSD